LQNEITHPFLVVPLQLPTRQAGRPAAVVPGAYKVRVEWTALRAPGVLQPYVVQKADEQMKALNAMAPVTVTIK
jgi:hypothetical protein